jgi:hypothetical protein
MAHVCYPSYSGRHKLEENGLRLTPEKSKTVSEKLVKAKGLAEWLMW